MNHEDGYCHDCCQPADECVCCPVCGHEACDGTCADVTTSFNTCPYCLQTDTCTGDCAA